MIHPFESWHLDAVYCETDEERAEINQHRPVMELLAARGLASTIIRNGLVIAVLGGGWIEREDECEVFIFGSRPMMKSKAVTFLRDIRQEIDRMKVRFAKIRALSNSELSARFLQHLGFELEGVCRRPGAEGRLVWAMNGGRA